MTRILSQSPGAISLRRRRKYKCKGPRGPMPKSEPSRSRLCNHCKHWWPRECFWRRKSSPDGLATECIACATARRNASELLREKRSIVEASHPQNNADDSQTDHSENENNQLEQE